MTIAANYTLFYGEEFIEYSVKSIYDHVDKIYMSVGEMSWKNHHGKRFEPIDNLLEKVYEIPDPDKKIEIFTGIWDGDTEQRNFLLDKCIGNYDYAMLIDSDEVWEKREIQGIKGVAEEFKEDPHHGQALSPTGDLWEPIIERELIPEMKGHRLSKVNYYTK
jgi:hypothetical protein